MADRVLGIHHVTAMSGDPQATVDFYGGILGQRLVKQTVNFDDPGTYHLYFGNGAGEPGTLLTFFPWGRHGMKGRVGNGQVSAISLLAPPGSLEFWQERLAANDVRVAGPEQRFGDDVLRFSDPDGMPLEIIVGQEVESAPSHWERGGINAEFAIRGMHSVTLSVDGYELTTGMMTGQLGFEPIGEAGSRFRLAVNGGGPGRIVDVFCDPDAPAGRMGVGAVHHIAFRTENDQTQIDFLNQLSDAGYGVTPVQHRQYFKSIYLREPGGVLFEIATDPPGFTVDESLDKLGRELKLPPWLEKHRKELEEKLIPLSQPVADSSKMKA